MKLIDFVSKVLQSELSCVQFLQSYGIVSSTMNCDCSTLMKLVLRKQRSGNSTIVWRCSKRACRKKKSVRSQCSFLAFKRADGRVRTSLTLRKLLELVYLWLYNRSTCRQMRIQTGCSLQSIADWLGLFREVCSHAIIAAPKLKGTSDYPVQIDEAYFRGRRKYSRGRMLDGDYQMPSNCSRSNNYGDLVRGPWVLGIYQNSFHVRFIVISDRKSETLLPIIRDYVDEGSTIVTDEWSAYNGLSGLGYTHETVNHSENYVNPSTGYHTQGVERAWVDAKAWMKRARYPSEYIQSHLNELSWRKMNQSKANELEAVFFTDVAQFYME